MDLAAKTRWFARTLGVIVLPSAAWALVALAASCSDQPKVRCAARGQFAAKYVLVSGNGDCSKLAGDLLGVGTYNGSNGDGTPNWDDATIAIQPYALAGLAGNGAMGDSIFSSGHFSTAEPNDSNFCDVPTLSAAEVHVAAITSASTDAMQNVTCPAPAMDVKYEWSDVRVVVSAAVLGTELAGDLTYTANGCVAKYRVWAVSPPISCALPITAPPPADDDASADDGAADGGAATDAMDESVTSDASTGTSSDASAADAGNAVDGGGGALPPACTMPPAATPAPMLDSTLCSPFPDLSKNRPLGSGLNPDLFPDGIACDTATTFCVLTRDPGL
jgi:hypothetical protein